MLSIPGSPSRWCDGVTRREFLQIGGLGAAGLALPDLFTVRFVLPSWPRTLSVRNFPAGRREIVRSTGNLPDGSNLVSTLRSWVQSSSRVCEWFVRTTMSSWSSGPSLCLRHLGQRQAAVAVGCGADILGSGHRIVCCLGDSSHEV